jgi:hypothetical protein
MPPAGFEPAIPSREQLETHVLDRAATGIDSIAVYTDVCRHSPKRDEATGEWRRLHNEELCDLYFSLNIIRVFKSRIMRWPGM